MTRREALKYWLISVAAIIGIGGGGFTAYVYWFWEPPSVEELKKEARTIPYDYYVSEEGDIGGGVQHFEEMYVPQWLGSDDENESHEYYIAFEETRDDAITGLDDDGLWRLGRVHLNVEGEALSDRVDYPDDQLLEDQTIEVWGRDTGRTDTYDGPTLGLNKILVPSIDLIDVELVED